MKKFRFAIMGAGGIANKFCDAVKILEECEVAAVSSKSMSRAEEFAQKNGIESAYDSYEKMLAEVRPDCVYIAVTTDAHYELCMLCLDYRIPILCEKAMFVNGVQAETVFRRAKELGIFAMEAMWSRFLPAVNKAKEWLDEGRIGKPLLCDVTLGFAAPKDKENRFYNPKLGGGIGYDITVYAYELTTYLIGQKIKEIQAGAIWADTGVDVVNNINIRFEHALASLKTTFLSRVEEQMIIYGDCGKIMIPRPHFGEQAFLYDENNELVSHYVDRETKNGFQYEIYEAYQCIINNKTQSSIVPHETTLECARLFDLLNEST